MAEFEKNEFKFPDETLAKGDDVNIEIEIDPFSSGSIADCRQHRRLITGIKYRNNNRLRIDGNTIGGIESDIVSSGLGKSRRPVECPGAVAIIAE